jgi:hypothetical protein
VNATVPLWAFVTLGLVAPVVTLIGVIVATQAESRRSHRNWLYQTKYESYERLFTAFFDMCDAYRDYLDAPTITESTLRKLILATNAFKSQYERTSLVSSLRVGFNMEIELRKTLIDIEFQIMAAKAGKPAPTPHRPWGASEDTRDAARYDLRVRQDPDGWRGRRKDRGTLVHVRPGASGYRPPTATSGHLPFGQCPLGWRLDRFALGVQRIRLGGLDRCPVTVRIHRRLRRSCAAVPEMVGHRPPGVAERPQPERLLGSGSTLSMGHDGGHVRNQYA